MRDAAVALGWNGGKLFLLILGSESDGMKKPGFSGEECGRVSCEQPMDS